MGSLQKYEFTCVSPRTTCRSLTRSPSVPVQESEFLSAGKRSSFAAGRRVNSFDNRVRNSIDSRMHSQDGRLQNSMDGRVHNSFDLDWAGMPKNDALSVSPTCILQL